MYLKDDQHRGELLQESESGTQSLRGPHNFQVQMVEVQVQRGNSYLLLRIWDDTWAICVGEEPSGCLLPQLLLWNSVAHKLFGFYVQIPPIQNL